jgi:hypothetical protein
MKNYFFAGLLAVLLTVPHVNIAQDTDPSNPCQVPQIREVAPWVSAKGYWTSEGNVNNTSSVKIFFYNNQHQLIYQERVDGNKVNFKKKKTLIKLKDALETAISKWENNQMALNDEKLVAKTLGLNLSDF